MKKTIAKIAKAYIYFFNTDTDGCVICRVAIIVSMMITMVFTRIGLLIVELVLAWVSMLIYILASDLCASCNFHSIL